MRRDAFKRIDGELQFSYLLIVDLFDSNGRFLSEIMKNGQILYTEV